MLYSLDMAAVSNNIFPVAEPEMTSRKKAGFLYARATSRGKWQEFWSKLRRKDNHLRKLPQVQGTARRLSSPTSAVVVVPLDKIVGSEGRARDFDRDFNPLSEYTQQRWISVAAAYRQGITLPPVDLIQVGDEYYVRDGHHRISVAKAFGQAVIEAKIAYVIA